MNTGAQVARSLLRRVTRGRLIRRRLPAEVGGKLLYVAPESQLRYLVPGARGLDRRIISWASRYANSEALVWDVGANAGVFAMTCVGMGAEVVAIEPDPFLANALLRTKRANQQCGMTIVSAAISSDRGIARLEISSAGRASNALLQFKRQSFGISVAELIVPTLTLDDLLPLGAPNLVKIDVEGAELAALSGAKRLLTEIRPIIYVELGPETWKESASLLRSHGYVLFDPDRPDELASEGAFDVLARPVPA